MASGPPLILNGGLRPPGTARTPSTPSPGLEPCGPWSPPQPRLTKQVSMGLCQGLADGPPGPSRAQPGRQEGGVAGDTDTHLVSAPVPGGHDGQTKGHPGPREVPCIGVSKHVHSVCPRQVAGRVGDGPAWDGLGIGSRQLLIPTDLVKSWRGRGRDGLLAGGPDSGPPLPNASNLTFSHSPFPVSGKVWRVEGLKSKGVGDSNDCFICI